MNERHAILLNEIRYAERLTQRTARLYRRAATAGTFIAAIGGTSLMASVAQGVPDWVRFFGLGMLALAGAATLAVRPLEKAITNEADSRKYASLRTQAMTMDTPQLEVALQKARESDAPEIELLRDVAYNDLVVEIGRDDLISRLSPRQRLLEAMA
jgi:hypothetical protein